MQVRKRRYRRWLTWPFLLEKCMEILLAFKPECRYEAEFFFYIHDVCFRTTTPLQDRSEATRRFDARSIRCWQAVLVGCKGRRLVTFDHNGLKCRAETKFYLEQITGIIGSFEELTVLIVQLNQLAEVNFD